MVDATTGRPIAVDDRTTPAAQDPAALREQIQQMLTPAVVADVDEAQHDPSARLARLVDLRDLYCCGPGCSSSRTERDHLQPWAQGPTSARNLKRESPRCHHAKHHGWSLTAHDDGSTTWTSPLTRRYWRPSPHSPPPKADLWQDPPPIRSRPTGIVPEEEDDHEAAGAPTQPEPAPPSVEPVRLDAETVWDDPPPF